MSHRCIICTFSAPAHPEVGNGYIPHPFEPADLVQTRTYVGADRRHLIRRMRDRISLLRYALGEEDHDATDAPERRSTDRRAS